MRLSIASRYAWRSLLRHRRRTFLSVAGVAIGCAICLFVVGFIRGKGEMFMRAAAASGAGHLRITPPGWRQTGENRLRLNPWEDLLTLAEGTPGVAVATPHARAEALLAMGTRTAGVALMGVDPAREPQANRLVQHLAEGRYLAPGETGATVIGQALADRLGVTVDDRLMATASGQGGEMESAMLRVVGIVATGSRLLDDTLCHVALADVGQLTGYPGVGDITLLADDPQRGLAAIRQSLAARIGKRAEVLGWQEVVPELAAATEVDDTWSRIIVGVITMVVFCGIASAQLAAALERRREFAVLSALGMKRGRMARIMLTEGFLLGGIGGLLALLVGATLTYLSATYGIDFSGMYHGTDLGVSNILIDPVLYSDFGWWLVPLALALSLGATMLSSLYPAWYAVRTDPAEALRVDQ